MRKKEEDNNKFLTNWNEVMNILANENKLNARCITQKCSSTHQAQTKMHYVILNELKHEMVEHEDELKKHDAFMQKKEKELAIAKGELENAKKKVNIAENTLSEAKKFHDSLEAEKAYLEQLIVQGQKIAKKMSRVVLIHESAEMIKKKINNYQLGLIVVNKCDDKGFIKDIVKPDRIVKSEELIEWYLQVPYEFKGKYNEKEEKSILAYCNLVMNVVSKIDDPSRIKLLYCNEDIAKILKMNGIKV